MLRKPTKFRPVLEPLEDRVVPRYSLIPWGEWSPIYHASVMSESQVSVPVPQRPSSPTSSGDTDIKGSGGDGDGSVITPSAVIRPGPIQYPRPISNAQAGAEAMQAQQPITSLGRAGSPNGGGDGPIGDPDDNRPGPTTGDTF